MRTVICNGTIVTATDVFQGDLAIEGEKIGSISRSIRINPGDQVIDATGCYVFPGGVDVHTHLEWPFQNTGTADDFVTGTRAAAAGGITTVINYTSASREQTLLENVLEWKKKASRSLIDYGFHILIAGYDPSYIREFPRLVEEGISSIKLFMAYKGELMVNDTEMYHLMKAAGRAGMLTNVHCENGDVIDQLMQEYLKEGKTDPVYHAYSRPPELEAEAVHRAVTIAQIAQAPLYVVHVSCRQSLEAISRARRQGAVVYAETCPHYLTLDIHDLMRPDFEGAKYICSPPLREPEHQKALWEGLAHFEIQTIGSDHCPFKFDGQKTLGRHDFSKIPNGVPTIEDSFAVVYHHGVFEGRIPITRFVEIMSTNPAKLFGLYPRKGTIAVGSDADLVIFDPSQRRILSKDTQFQNTDYNLFEGIEVQGKIRAVLSRGEVIVRDGEVVGRNGRGRFLPRRACAGGEAGGNRAVR